MTICKLPLLDDSSQDRFCGMCFVKDALEIIKITLCDPLVPNEELLTG